MFPLLGFEPKLWPQRTQQEGAGTYCSRVLSAVRTLIVDVEGADCRVEGLVVHLLTGYLGPLTFVTWPRPLLIHALMCPTHMGMAHGIISKLKVWTTPVFC